MSGPKSSPIGFVKLHRIHANPQASRCELNSIGMHWRGEGGDPKLKAAIAYRLALCWNVLEGIPTSKLEAGLVRKLCDAVMDGDLAAAQKLVEDWSDTIDMTNGRAHDCKQCMGVEDPVELPDGVEWDESEDAA